MALLTNKQKHVQVVKDRLASRLWGRTGRVIIVGLTLLLMNGLALSPANAASAPTGTDGGPTATTPCTPGDPRAVCVTCTKDTLKINGETSTCTDPAAQGCSTGNSCDLVAKYLNPAITLLSGLVGVVAVVSLITAGIQYSSSAGDPQKVSAAKTRIFRTVMALLAFAFLYAFLQFIIPGGLFKT